MTVENKILVRIWPDGTFVTEDEWNEELYKFMGDDCEMVYVSDEWSDEDIENFIFNNKVIYER